MNQIRSAAPVVETTSEDAVTMVLVPRSTPPRQPSGGASRNAAQLVSLPSDLEKMFAAAEARKPLPRPAEQMELAKKVVVAVAARKSQRDLDWVERLAGDLATATD